MKPAKSNYQFKLDPQNVIPILTNHRVIKTKIPHPEDIKIFNQIMNIESSLVGKQLPVVWDHAEDFSIFDRSLNSLVAKDLVLEYFLKVIR